MTTHGENPTGVQEKLWHLINDKVVSLVLKAMIEKMKPVEDCFERIKQWREEAKAYIPEDPKYDENYWVAAYILYANMENFKDLLDELDNIKQELSKIENEIKELKHNKRKLKYIMENLRDELKSLPKDKENKVIEDLTLKLRKYKEDLKATIETYYEKSDRYYDLDKKVYSRLLPKIIEHAERLVEP